MFGLHEGGGVAVNICAVLKHFNPLSHSPVIIVNSSLILFPFLLSIHNVIMISKLFTLEIVVNLSKLEYEDICLCEDLLNEQGSTES